MAGLLNTYIWCLGLFDYLKDHVAISLINKMWDWTRDGGRIIFGNFHPKDPSRNYFVWILDWILIYRIESELIALCQEAGIPSGSIQIQQEPSGVNLFCVITKSINSNINILQPDNRLKNAIVYIDFENIAELLKKFGHDPLKMDFFGVIQDKLITSGLKIIDSIVFNNFEKDSASGKLQTLLRALGLQTRHASNNGKNSSDLELTVNAMGDLFRNPNIEVFVIVSSDRDIIPLLKEIKYENKLAYVISTKSGFNPTVIKHADSHAYIEDIFKLPPSSETVINRDELLELTGIDPASVDPAKIQRAEEVAGYFYKSHIRAQALLLGKPINLKGYLAVIARIIQRSPADILDDFKLAHCLKYITIYQHPARGLCLKEGKVIFNR